MLGRGKRELPVSTSRSRTGGAYPGGMATEPVELDAKLLAKVRDTTDDARGYVESAVRRQLDDQAFSRLLDELEAES
jgi:hypothetical protein